MSIQPTRATTCCAKTMTWPTGGGTQHESRLPFFWLILWEIPWHLELEGNLHSFGTPTLGGWVFPSHSLRENDLDWAHQNRSIWTFFSSANMEFSLKQRTGCSISQAFCAGMLWLSRSCCYHRFQSESYLGGQKKTPSPSGGAPSGRLGVSQ